MSQVDVIAAGPAHAAIVAALHAETFNDAAWSIDWVARILALPGAIAALALASDPASADGAREPVGFAVCLPAGEAFDLLSIGVLATHRRAGIALTLLARCEENARAAGAKRLMLEVADDNGDARAFYRSAGYAETGRRRGYYRGHPGVAPRDAIVFSKVL